MSNTPYFDAYERRRAWRNSTVLTDPTVSQIAIGTGFHGSFVNTIASASNFITESAYPKYRLQKNYTFINEVKILQDCELEIQETPGSNWRVVETPFCSYE